jgi:ABC-type branched-subunit amino acid transport system ATPase component
MAQLSVRSLIKRFDGLTALNNFNLDVDEGEIVGIIGPNGSGKTTFFNVLSGIHPADSGEVFFDNHPENLLKLKTHQIVGLGIARTFQIQRPFNNLSVLENLMIGGHCRTQAGLFSALINSASARKEREQLKAHAREVMALFGTRLRSVEMNPAWTLSYANRRRLEIARALVSDGKLLLIDEPTAGMNPAESLQLAQTIQAINKKGIAVLVIEHDMKFIKKLCTRVVALDYGQKIVEGTYAEVRNHPKVIEAYLGRD